MTEFTAHRSSDFYLVDETLGEQERSIVPLVRSFVDERVLPVINDYWERAEFPWELLPDLARLGIAGGAIHGHGSPGLTRLGAGIVAREISRGDGSLNTFFAVHSGLAMGSVDMLGSEEQKARWLPAMARLERIGAFALTEPNHGSDSVALETTARRQGDHYVLNGSKRWIGNAHFADLVILWARDEADGDVKGFVVEKNADGSHPDGYHSTVITGKIGKRAIPQSDLRLVELRVPVENRLANAESFRDVARVLATTRSGAAWESLGHATAAYEIALRYAQERQQFGRPIASFQLVQNRLANILSELTAMTLMCHRLAQLADAGKLTSAMASLAKMHAAQKGRWICAEARDILGGNGLLLENHVARHIGDMEVVHTYEGTDSIQSLLVGREITGISAFK